MVAFFRDKNNPQFDEIININKNIKREIDEFKPKVPLLMALKQEGMKDRHWDEISSKVGFDIRPNFEEFNFDYILKQNLESQQNFCISVGEKS